MKKLLCILTLLFTITPIVFGKTYKMESYGVKPGAKNISVKVAKAMDKIKKASKGQEVVVIEFLPGRYDFHPEGATSRNYYISNHDQTDAKLTGISIEDFKNLTINGNGAEFIFHGTMLPVALVGTEGCTLKNFSIDFANPHISQVEIIRNEGKNGIFFKPADYVKHRVAKNGILETYGDDWELHPWCGMAFDSKTGHIIQGTGDILTNTENLEVVEEGLLHAPKWIDERITPGTIVVMRTGHRPAPGIFLASSKDVTVKNVTVHYAFGMGLLAQLCNGITLDGFNVTTSGDRFFTTQADATHFSQCKGLINSKNGVYEGMMDDAINIHGIYLKITKLIDAQTIQASYMHNQAWGFDWGFEGDSVQVINPKTMEQLHGVSHITSIKAVDKETAHGAKTFEIKLSKPIKGLEEGMGIENLSWLPEVVFSESIVRNNRARGALFSSPLRTIVENNIFDHTSGSAILLCGDCNGWYESGSCRDIVIRKNQFINALTSNYQFTNAVISIYPEIPDIKHQTEAFHGGHEGAIVIENNEFQTFGTPLLYAKSTDGLIFRNNTIIENNDFVRPAKTSKVILEKNYNIEIDL